MSISRRGTIWNSKPRRMIAKYIYVRIILAISELLTVIVCSVAVYDPAVTDQLIEECSGYKKAILSAQVLVAFLWLILLLFVIKGLLFVDPLGLFTPGLLQHLSFLDTTDNVGDLPSPDSGESKQSTSPDFMLKEPSLTTADTLQVSFHYLHRAKRISSRIDSLPLQSLQRQYSKVYRSNVGQRGLIRRLQAICCCLGVGGHRSRGNALEDVAKALYAMLDFEDVDLVLSDVISGLVLLNKDQKKKKKRRPMSLVERFREVGLMAGETHVLSGEVSRGIGLHVLSGEVSRGRIACILVGEMHVLSGEVSRGRIACILVGETHVLSGEVSRGTIACP